MVVSTIQFPALNCQLLVDRPERCAFVMDYNNADHLGMFQVVNGDLLWHPIGDVDAPEPIVLVVQSMIGGRFDFHTRTSERWYQ